ncbi:MAG: septation protein A [Alphaproteobacteria bacterium]|nr:septation protein A [Alphaproteobacteria bacterium]
MSWLKPLVEYGPLIAFFTLYLIRKNLFEATAVLIIVTIIGVVLAWIFEKRIPLLPLITALIVSFFGGLTLLLHDEIFIKMKPTIAQLFFALILSIGLFLKKPLLKSVLGGGLSLSAEGWNKLTKRFILFFIAMAVLNELVWRTQSTDFWVHFKVLGLIGLTILFMLLQIPLFKKYQIPTDNA